jgi:hypothetical protein
VTWLGLFIIGVKRLEQQSEFHARNCKLLICFENVWKGGKSAFVAEQK